MPFRRKFTRRRRRPIRRRPVRKFAYRSRRSKPRAMVLRQPTALPDTIYVKLRYFDTTPTRTNNTGFGLSWRMRTSVYDPDPLIATGGIPGYNEWASFYQTYRVLAVSWKTSICNNESFPIIWNQVPTRSDLGANYVTNYMSDLPYAKSKMLSAKGAGGDRQTLKGYMSGQKIFGSKSYLYDPNTLSNVSSNPTSMFFINNQCISANATGFTTAGVSQDTVYTFYVQFFNRSNIFA